MINNFLRVYDTNRAPFGVYMTTSWFQKGENFFGAYKEFINYLNSLPDVYLVSTNQVIEYVRNPRQGKPFDKCTPPRQHTCEPRMCHTMKKQATWIEDRYMTICGQTCPEVYPWVGNPLGEQQNFEE
jgi:hypothetical protein